MSALTKTPSLLIVDDDPDICLNLTDIFEDMGYTVDTAENGMEALKLARKQLYDVALLDLKMPGMDGLTLYRELKKIRAGTVAIVVSAYTSQDKETEALAAGAWRVLSKPVELTQLLPIVEEAVRQPLVLIVDDDPDLCENLWSILREKGYRVCLANSEEEAEEKLNGTQYNVVLIDMKLPTGDGAKVFHLVRRTNPDARAVMITGHRTEVEELVRQVESEGADAICYKPFDMPHLLNTIQHFTAMTE